MALTDSLVAWWRLDGDGTDATGRGNTLTNSGASWVAGLVGQAADLESTESDYLYSADTADLSVGASSYTVCGWVKAETLGGRWVSKYSASSNREYLSYLSSTELFFRVYRGAGGGLTLATVTVPGSYSVGAWYFLVVYHDADANVIGASVNGGVPTTAATGGFDAADTTAVFYLGAEAGINLWDGLIDMVGIWKRVLTAPEITQLYNAGAGLDYPFAAAGLPVIAWEHARIFGP